MKIICFTPIGDEVKMVLKGDSSLLVNRKPFFIPDWSHAIHMRPCRVYRVSRLGKNIGARFAHRYYDALAHGLNIFAADYLQAGDWTCAFAFDYALPMGDMLPLTPCDEALVLPIDAAIEQASSIMTIRQGDLIAIDLATPARPLTREELIVDTVADREVLYCKIK